MTKESVALGVAGVLFGFLSGWIIGAQQGQRRVPTAAPPPQAAAGTAQPGQGGASAPQEPPRLDQARVDALRQRAADNPKDAAVRAELGNAYFDAERYPEAITWYEASLALDATNVNVSTDLGVSYYYSNDADRALAQFDRSLQIDPKHTKTMLNIGVVRAFGKQDLAGATRIWQQVADMAPGTTEGQAARRMIEAVRSAHPETGAPAGGAPAAGSPSAGSASRPQENGGS
jgi:cytochrome c-type biogenesis protein CcmH/NrfG